MSDNKKHFSNREAPVSWKELLTKAVTEPGLIHSAYSRFHRYSVGNQLLALWQCEGRGITPGPIATFQAWKSLGRNVAKGEKAIVLAMPVQSTHTKTVQQEDRTEEEVKKVYTRFTYQARWFALAQTEGESIQFPETPAWDREQALRSLGISQEEFSHLDGNCQGYAKKDRIIAVSPIAALPHKTFFHEAAHVILRHTEEGTFDDTERTPKNIREVEAESVALICCEALGLPGAEFSRGYIQSWAGGEEITDRSAQRIFHAADQILKAGSDRAPEHVRGFDENRSLANEEREAGPDR